MSKGYTTDDKYSLMIPSKNGDIYVINLCLHALRELPKNIQFFFFLSVMK